MFTTSFIYMCLCVSLVVKVSYSEQFGPDPWHYEEKPKALNPKITDSPSYDLLDHRTQIKEHTTCNCNSQSDWFFKRMLGIVLKGGQVKENNDGTIEVGVQMQFNLEKWKLLNQYLSSKDTFSEEMFRRSIGYIEDAIYKPTIMEKISMAWMEYIHTYIVLYKDYLTWCLVFLTAICGFNYIWKRMSHKHIIITGFVFVYCYEAFISYKEAEQKEYESFVSALNNCKWQFWSTECHVPAPNPLLFLKYMHPVKIGLKIFSMLFTEPLLIITSIMQKIAHEITDGLWFPFNKLVYIGLVLIMTILIIMFVIMILFNFILNIPFNLSLFAGLINFGVLRRKRQLSTQDNVHIQNEVKGDRLSGATLDKFLTVCASAIKNSSDNNKNRRLFPVENEVKSIKSKSNFLFKSSSLSRLSDFVDGTQNSNPKFKNELRNRKIQFEIGSGDTK